MIVINYIAFILLCIGGLNWGLVGFLQFNLVTALFGSERNIGTIVIYTLVFLSMLWLIFSVIYSNGLILFRPL